MIKSGLFGHQRILTQIRNGVAESIITHCAAETPHTENGEKADNRLGVMRGLRGIAKL